MKKNKLSYFLAAGLVVMMSTQVFAEDSYTEDFSSGIAAGWDLSDGISVKDEKLKPDDGCYASAFYTGREFTGAYRYSARVANWASGEDTDICLILNAKDADNYCYLALNGSVYDTETWTYSQKGSARLYNRVQGEEHLLGTCKDVVVNDGAMIDITYENGTVSAKMTDNYAVTTQLFSDVAVPEFAGGYIGVRNRRGMGYVDDISVTLLHNGTKQLPIDSALDGWKTNGTVQYEERDGKKYATIPEKSNGSYAVYDGLPAGQSYTLTATITTYGYGGGDAGEILFNGSNAADAKCFYMVPYDGKVVFYENTAGWNGMGVPDFKGFEFNDKPFKFMLQYNAEQNTVTAKICTEEQEFVMFDSVPQKAAPAGGLFGIGTYGDAAIKITDIVIKAGKLTDFSVENQKLLTDKQMPVTNLSAVAGQNITYQADVLHNRYGAQSQCVLLLAVYDEDKTLQQVETLPQKITTAWGLDQTVNKTFMLSAQAKDSWRIKAMYWSDMELIKPLLRAQKVY